MLACPRHCLYALWLLLASARGEPSLSLNRGDWLPANLWRDVTASHQGCHSLPACRAWSQAEERELLSVSHFEQLWTLFRRLNEGLPVTVVALGSSITASYGGCFHNGLSQLRSRLAQTPSSLGDNDERLACSAGHRFGFLGVLMHAINRTWPHTEHLLVNLAQGGHTLRSFVDQGCLVGQALPDEVDLVVVEQYEQVDKRAGSRRRREGLEVERLWHQLRVHQQRRGAPPPPLLLLNFFQWLRAEDPLSLQSCVDNLGAHCSRPECASMAWLSRAALRETVLDELAQYYGFSSFSLRSFVWSVLRGNATSPCALLSRVWRDRIHPSDPGTQLVGDALVQHLAEAGAFLSAHPSARSHSAPMESLIPSAWQAHRERVCVDAQHLAVVSQRDWALQATEAAPGGALRKAGLVSSSGAAELEVRIDAFNASAGRRAKLSVQHLRSYTAEWGKATMRCAGGCRCTAVVLDSLYDEAERARRVSLAEAQAVQLFPAAPNEPCLLRLAVDAAGEGRGHKMKLLGMMVEA